MDPWLLIIGVPLFLIVVLSSILVLIVALAVAGGWLIGYAFRPRPLSQQDVVGLGYGAYSGSGGDDGYAAAPLDGPTPTGSFVDWEMRHAVWDPLGLSKGDIVDDYVNYQIWGDRG
jgi:hypothetical protein